MENNVIKENYLEVIPKRELIKTEENNKLPIVTNRSELLPVVINQKELALIEIKREFSKVKDDHSVLGILRFLKKAVVLFAKLIRWSILASSKVITFAVVSAIIVISTTIITKNIINSQYGTDTSEDRETYSIFKVKDDIVSEIGESD